jgi:hypothetical protein
VRKADTSDKPQDKISSNEQRWNAYAEDDTKYLINFESYTDVERSLGDKITGCEVKEKAPVIWLGWQLALSDA